MSAPSGGVNYVDDVFSTYLYTGNGTTNNIVNGIDLAGEGGMVWVKDRTSAYNHVLYDTARGTGTTKGLCSNTTNAQGAFSANQNLSAFNANGFSLGSTSSTNVMNANGDNFASWTFRKQPKFFDVVTYTGTGSAQTITHNLGSVPGCIIVKKLSGGSDWRIYHRSVGNGYAAPFGTSVFSGPYDIFWNNTSPTSTQFTVGTYDDMNESGATYVAYIFAHDAGGFGTTGADNAITCGSWASDGTYKKIELGYEPQFLIIKRTDTSDNWKIIDDMRNWGAPPTSGNLANILSPDNNTAESVGGLQIYKDATGFIAPDYGVGRTYIYIAIRKPMKPPTTGTSVYGAQTNPDTANFSFPPDLVWATNRTGDSTYSNWFVDRLRGSGNVVRSHSTGAETSESYSSFSPNGAQTTWGPGWSGVLNYFVSGFRRASGFLDTVCYEGTGSARTITHNLTVAPEMMIVKNRSDAQGWRIYHTGLGGNSAYQTFGNSDTSTSSVIWNNTAPTSSVFSVGNTIAVNDSGYNYVAHLFATLPGVSKVGSYTGTGTTNSINCGFTSGARFVLIKSTANITDWYLWDSTRGIVSGNDPYLLLNSTNAEVTSTDYIDPLSSGFQISSTAPAAINSNGGTFIYLAIA